MAAGEDCSKAKKRILCSKPLTIHGITTRWNAVGIGLDNTNSNMDSKN